MTDRLRYLVFAPALLAASYAEGAGPSAPTSAGAQTGGDLGPYRTIIQSGVFGEVSSGASGTVAPPQSSPYRLIGTIEGGGERSGAVVDDGSGAQTFYRVGQRLPDGSRLVRVRRDRVLLSKPDGTSGELIVTDEVRASSAPAGAGNVPSAAPAAEGATKESGPPLSPRPRRGRHASQKE